LCPKLALVQGEYACAGGALVCFGGLCSLLELDFVSDVSSRCPSLRGDLSSSSDLVVCFSLAFDHLLEFLFILFFSFSFPSGYYMCVLSMHSSRAGGGGDL
jgi:hypothetical protein